MFYPAKMNTSNHRTKIMSGAGIARRRRTSATAFRLRDLASVPNPEDLTPPWIVQEARGIHDTRRPQGRRPQEDGWTVQQVWWDQPRDLQDDDDIGVGARQQAAAVLDAEVDAERLLVPAKSLGTLASRLWQSVVSTQSG